MNQFTALFEAGVIPCFLVRVNEMPEEFSLDWDCYEVHHDGFTRRSGTGPLDTTSKNTHLGN